MALRVLMNRGFARAARKEALGGAALRTVASEIASGLIDARLGGCLVKKRIGRGGRGKSGGLRTIIAYQAGDRLVFLYLFAKNQRDNITGQERLALAELGDAYLRLSPEELEALLVSGVLIEVAWQ